MTWTLDWTFDHGRGFVDDLWHIVTIHPGKIRAWPLRAWPVACQVHDRWDLCRDATCVRHKGEKLANFHERQTRYLNPPHLRASRKRRASDSQWEAESRKWLQEREALDADTESEGDAFQDARTELGNDSGPFEGPVNA
jgi:hypothetical protein